MQGARSGWNREGALLGEVMVKGAEPSHPFLPQLIWNVTDNVGHLHRHYVFNENVKSYWEQIVWNLKCLGLGTLLRTL